MEILIWSIPISNHAASAMAEVSIWAWVRSFKTGNISYFKVSSSLEINQAAY
jgi:hypothetical protein